MVTWAPGWIPGMLIETRWITRWVNSAKHKTGVYVVTFFVVNESSLVCWDNQCSLRGVIATHLFSMLSSCLQVTFCLSIHTSQEALLPNS